MLPTIQRWAERFVCAVCATVADGSSLAVVIARANVHDTKLLKKTLEAVVVEYPNATTARAAYMFG